MFGVVVVGDKLTFRKDIGVAEDLTLISRYKGDVKRRDLTISIL